MLKYSVMKKIIILVFLAFAFNSSASVKNDSFNLLNLNQNIESNDFNSPLQEEIKKKKKKRKKSNSAKKTVTTESKILEEKISISEENQPVNKKKKKK